MGGIAEQEGAAFAEMLRHPVMDVIGREPVDALDLDVEAVDEARADIIKGEIVARLGLALDRADEPRSPGALQRKDRQELRLVEPDIQLAIHRAAARLDIRDVEDVRVGAAWKADLQRLTHDRMCAVAACDEGSLDGLLRSVRPPQARRHPRVLVLEADKFPGALDRDANLPEAIDQ